MAPAAPCSKIGRGSFGTAYKVGRLVAKHVSKAVTSAVTLYNLLQELVAMDLVRLVVPDHEAITCVPEASAALGAECELPASPGGLPAIVTLGGDRVASLGDLVFDGRAADVRAFLLRGDGGTGFVAQLVASLYGVANRLRFAAAGVDTRAAASSSASAVARRAGAAGRRAPGRSAPGRSAWARARGMVMRDFLGGPMYHKDIKPDNVFLAIDTDGGRERHRVRLGDFGLMGSDDGQIQGTAHYMGIERGESAGVIDRGRVRRGDLEARDFGDCVYLVFRDPWKRTLYSILMTLAEVYAGVEGYLPSGAPALAGLESHIVYLQNKILDDRAVGAPLTARSKSGRLDAPPRPAGKKRTAERRAALSRSVMLPFARRVLDGPDGGPDGGPEGLVALEIPAALSRKSIRDAERYETSLEGRA